MNLEEIKLLIDIISETDVTELELKNGDSKIRIKGGVQEQILLRLLRQPRSRLKSKKLVKAARKKIIMRK